jgi:hypothetical protein
MMALRAGLLRVMLSWGAAILLLTNAVAGPLDLGGHTKAEVDAAAQRAGFVDADYPYYSRPNGCGPDGWKSRLIPQRSHLILGANFGKACDAHDRAYMTLGKSRSEADREFRKNLRGSVASHQMSNLVAAAGEFLRPPQKGPRPDLGQRLKAQAEQAKKDLWRPWKWRRFLENQQDAVQEILLDEARHQADKALGGVGLEKASFMLKPSRTLEMLALAEVYYQAVRRVGAKYYEESQARQREYEAWLAGYLKGVPDSGAGAKQ